MPRAGFSRSDGGCAGEPIIRRASGEAWAAALRTALQRRLAKADVAAARTRNDLAGENAAALDDGRRAAMVSSALVVLGLGSGALPVVNTGTLYS